MQQGHHHPRHQDHGDSGGLTEMIFAIIWFVVSYLPFVLIGIGTGVGLYKYAHLSQFVCGIFGVLSGMASLGTIRAIDRVSNRMEGTGSLWYIPLKVLIVAAVAGLPFALGYSLGSSFVSERSSMEKLVAGGFGGLLLAGPSYFRVMVDDAWSTNVTERKR